MTNTDRIRLGPSRLVFNTNTTALRESGGVVAYACNYQGVSGQWCYHDTIVNNLNSVSNTCGWNTAGWWSNGQGISSWGYQASGVGFC
ncbi:hypothetical protein B0H66DRAFT_643911 [Apodospora peruviana]|uniref:Uncharacterized protein n=1 Tax=Apodospora peruviana TaxID=516989 RepID=A0AAE0HTS5_9PEZI|nr:hypothetical protein B0H66DRAFT_643911 [Apodospora peruviana]